MNKRLAAFKYAIRGVFLGFKLELHLKVHLFFAVAVSCLGLYFEISRIEWMIILLCIGMVIAAELFNSAIEHLANRISLEKDPLIGNAKDLAAGAVLIAAFVSLVIGLIIFIPYIWLLIS